MCSVTAMRPALNRAIPPYSTTKATAQRGYERSDGVRTLRSPIPLRMGLAITAPDGDSPAFPLVRACVEPPAGIEPATPSLP
jgi:hypothetical protein